MNKIDAVTPITPIEIYKILTSPTLTDNVKAEFIRKNATEIKNTMKTEITESEFKQLMNERPLIRFRPLKNSYTKQGDDILLAKTLNIDKKNIKKYINSIIDTNFEIQTDLNKNKLDAIKTYVYRHGTKDQVVAFLEYELSDVESTLESLYKTLDLNSGGLAGYFSRPIHRMDDNTLRKLYKVIDKSLNNSANAGYIDKTKLNSTAEWALVKIYEIQNSSKLIRALEVYNTLK